MINTINATKNVLHPLPSNDTVDCKNRQKNWSCPTNEMLSSIVSKCRAQHFNYLFHGFAIALYH